MMLSSLNGSGQLNYQSHPNKLAVQTPIKLTDTLESDLIIKITKVRFQWESQTGLNSE